MANDFTGRILRITATGVIPLANLKVEGGNWTGATAGEVFAITDVAGREYTWTFPTEGDVTITKLGWLSGPVTITTIGGGQVLLYLGTR
jgi:hypothetical protein